MRGHVTPFSDNRFILSFFKSVTMSRPSPHRISILNFSCFGGLEATSQRVLERALSPKTAITSLVPVAWSRVRARLAPTVRASFPWVWFARLAFLSTLSLLCLLRAIACKMTYFSAPIASDWTFPFSFAVTLSLLIANKVLVCLNVRKRLLYLVIRA